MASYFPEDVHGRRHRQTASTGQLPSYRSLSSSVRGVRRLETRRAMDSRFLSQKVLPTLQVDYRQLEYVAEPDDNLVCAICRCPFVDPVVLECDHYFCRECIRRSWSANRGDCPSCRAPGRVNGQKSSKLVANMLDDLEVRCPKADSGCTAQLKRGQAQDHVALYCGFVEVDCQCTLPVLRKDAAQGCLHYGVCCIDCRQDMLKSTLERHWRECPKRKLPSVSIACSGAGFGCISTFMQQAQADEHSHDCVLAKLAPVLSAQRQRLDEHEAAQRHMSRKLEVLEAGMANMQILLSHEDLGDPDSASADESRIPLLPNHRRANSFEAARSNFFLDDIPTPTHDPPAQDIDPFPDFDQSLPPLADHGPFASPIHHLLSMHESLRSEVSRIAAAVQELDARHSMQTLNENIRTREELAYLSGQVAGMNRHVQRLTSAHLQHQGRSRGEYEIASAGAGVEAAVASAASALRGAVRIVGGGGEPIGAPLTRRRTSDEGRTKL